MDGRKTAAVAAAALVSVVVLAPELRSRALEEDSLEEITLGQLDGALAGEPVKGKVADALTPVEVRRLPREGRQKLVDLFNTCERCLAWPWPRDWRCHCCPDWGCQNSARCLRWDWGPLSAY